jgi:tetratricopeptide (TPR) repeat protein
MYNILTCLVFALLIFFSACSGDPNEKANGLYVNASQKVKGMIGVNKSYSNVLETYKDARKDIELILSKYSSSNLAVSLSSGQTRIGNFTLNEFMELENALAPLAKAEQDPLSCAILVVEEVDKYDEKAKGLARVATICANNGQDENAVQLLSQAVDAAEKIGDEYDKILALVDIAGKYIESGHKDKGAQVLSQALDGLKRNAGAGDGYYLSEIASKYAVAGQVSSSIEVVESIKKDQYYSGLPLAKAAVILAQAGEKDRAGQLLSQALDAANTFNDEHSDISDIYAEIALSFAKAGMFSKSLEVTGKIADEDYNLKTIVRIHIMEGHLEDALDTADRIDGKYYKSKLLSEVAAAYAEAGNDGKATELFSQALVVAKALSAEIMSDSTDKDNGYKDNGYGVQASLFAAIAGNCSKARRKEQAGQLLSEALAITDRISDEENKRWHLVNIANAYVEGDIKPNQNDIVLFSNFVNKVHPMNLFWETINQD